MSLTLKSLATAFPERIVDNTYFGEDVQSTHNPMFMGTQYRRHLERDQTGADLIANAVKKILPQMPDNKVDILLTNVAVPDEFFTGCGAVVCKKTGLRATHIYDLHNTGCVAFLFMLQLAESLMKAHDLNSALLCTAQTAGGRIFAQASTRKKAQAAIPGDGCAVVYVTRQDQAQIVASVLENFSDYAEDMFGSYDDGRKYWEPGLTSGYIDFTEAKVAKIISRGNKLVPQMARRVCEKAGVSVRDITWLITNQPNLHFLRNWREALQLREEQHLHTFQSYANLFGAGIPITLAEHAAAGTFQPGDLICLAGFSHAGDYAGATLLRW
ncbi:MAG TPA: 3-oxoacyl-[acyl-carrier-protein] synthase III C-terminal domain-containing protein [Oligoflexus sp.]|uniref:3-oxoacyl-ACP synthase III family protein n=1 Tax=Oligoflexus sp. TaxID=1971216 RepID=UPI002D749EA9|nr:3-oxoacyl-[acyl-carrier-protein] synthase III C-terminal domain-containing protein [Oligoflexus sp.]HYX34602.1 3-oxoacyl-[acyl-carrier-protein] synthase III C-terminal domain-containing protein [Oligoflexus sp.]